MAVDIARVLSAIGPGLMAAGQQGWGAFGPGVMQGAQFYDQGVDRKRQIEMDKLTEEVRRQQLDDMRTANQDAVKERQALESMFSPLGPQPVNNGRPGGMAPQPGPLGGGIIPPDLAGQFASAPTSVKRAVLEQVIAQRFAEPDKPEWKIETIREGNQDVTYRINPATGEREKLGAGAAWAPQEGQSLTERQRNAAAAGLIPGTPAYNNYILGNESEGGPFQGKALDAQAMNILLTGDPSKPEYAAAYAHVAAPRTVLQADGTVQTVTPDVSWAKKPTGLPEPPVTPGAQTTQVPGGTVTTLPGSGVTPQDRQKLRSVEAEAAAIKDALTRFKDVVKETGPIERGSALAGGLSEGGRKLNSAWTNAAIMTKAEALFNLGVLNGPDLSVIQGTLPNPATVEGAMASDEAYNAAIDEVLRLIDSKVASFQAQYGGTPYTQPNAAPAGNIPPPPAGFQVLP